MIKLSLLVFLFAMLGAQSSWADCNWAAGDCTTSGLDSANTAPAAPMPSGVTSGDAGYVDSNGNLVQLATPDGFVDSNGNFVPITSSGQKLPLSGASGSGAVQADLLGPNCGPAYAQAMSECSTSGGTGSKVAASINSAATVINIQQSQSPADVNSACKSAEDSAIANGLGNGVISYACMSANSACNAGCIGEGYPYAAYDAAALTACKTAYNTFKWMSAAQGITTIAQVALAGRCGTQTNPAAPVLPGQPGYQGPAADEPQNAGMQPYTGNGGPVQTAPATDGMSGGGGLPITAYPGGAAATGQSKKDSNDGITSPALGLTSGGGGGGGWPSGTAGQPGAAAGGAAPLDLSALLPGHAGDPSRGPASVASEVTGANDLSNFQKVTRMMNKKRPVLKSGEGV